MLLKLFDNNNGYNYDHGDDNKHDNNTNQDDNYTNTVERIIVILIDD